MCTLKEEFDKNFELDKEINKTYVEIMEVVKKTHKPTLQKFIDETGLRISEFCGLIDTDLDFENRLINVERQLLRNTERDYYIDDTKTDNGVRKVPMSDKAFEIFRRIVNNRKSTNTIDIDGYSGFLFLKRNGYLKK